MVIRNKKRGKAPLAHKNVKPVNTSLFLFSPNTKLIHQKTTTNMLLHNVLLLSVCQYTSGFTTAPSSSAARLAPLKNGYLDSINADNNNNGNNNGEPQQPTQPAVREAPSMIDLDITDGRQSNLSFRDNRNWASVNDDPRMFDVNSRSVYSCFVFVYFIVAVLCQCPLSFI